MGKIPTQDLLNEFFNTDVGKSRIKGKRVLDNPNLYEYEENIQKELVDMNDDELTNLIDNLISDKDVEVNALTSSTVQYATALLKAVFNYYIGNYDKIINPFTYNVERMTSSKLFEELCGRKKPYTMDYVNEVMSRVRVQESETKADYYESIILLAYNGFASPKEIVNLKERMIDHRTKTVALSGRTIKLSDRCYELLVKVHNYSGSIDNPRFVWAGWKDTYYKYCTRNGRIEDFDNMDIDKLVSSLNNTISKINNKLSPKAVVDFSKLYRLGFYDFLIEKYGKDRTNQILTSNRVTQDVHDLLSAARIYGINSANPTALKNDLIPFIR